jgi:isopentenyldiphosphate isomerase
VEANRTEIESTRFLSVDRLEKAFRNEPDTFTPWFVMEWQRLRNDYAGLLENYTRQPTYL